MSAASTPEPEARIDDAKPTSIISKDSPFFSAGLSCHVVGDHVFGYLTCHQVLQALEVEELCEQFNLKKYYCSDHGSKLESQAELREELFTEVGEEDEASHNPTHPECVDCVEAEFGRERCPQCDEFSGEEEITICERCAERCCDGCDALEMGFCEECDCAFCQVSKDCPLVRHCVRCDTGYCSDCNPLVICEKCGEDHGCVQCSETTSFTCGRCFSEYCHECQNHTFCTICSEYFCRTCKPTFYCDFCGERHCMDHGEPTECDACGDRGCSNSKSFQCSECETVTCSSCTKGYSCPECDKDICADCQSVFRVCCCKGKGKFRLKSTTRSWARDNGLRGC